MVVLCRPTAKVITGSQMQLGAAGGTQWSEAEEKAWCSSVCTFLRPMSERPHSRHGESRGRRLLGHADAMAAPRSCVRINCACWPYRPPMYTRSDAGCPFATPRLGIGAKPNRVRHRDVAACEAARSRTKAWGDMWRRSWPFDLLLQPGAPRPLGLELAWSLGCFGLARRSRSRATHELPLVAIVWAILATCMRARSLTHVLGPCTSPGLPAVAAGKRP